MSKKALVVDQTIKSAERAKKAAKATPTPNKRGRPSKYTPELGQKVCDLIATSDKGLKRICAENPELPEAETIRMWVWKHEDFHAQYVRAKESQQEWMIELAKEIADDGSNDTYVDDDNQIQTNYDVIQRSRLRVDTIKWQASKLAAKRFGDKLALGGADDLPPIKTQGDADLDARLSELLAKQKADAGGADV